MLCVPLRLLHGRYDAGIGWEEAEWPPHPGRLFCALVASARDERDWKVLGALERAAPPEVWAAGTEDVRTSVHTGFVVINSIEKRGKNQFWPGRKSDVRTRASALPPDDGALFVWRDVSLDAGDLAILGAMARRVPYLGRSTSVVTLGIETSAGGREGWRRYAPTGTATGRYLLRVAYPGYLERLRRAYEEGARAWEVERSVGYDLVREDEEPGEPARSPFSDLVIFGFSRPVVAPAGSQLLTFTDALRRAVIASVPDPLPGVVSGHGADGRCHAGFLGLVDVGYSHADGHLLGLGVALPPLPSFERKSVLRGLLGIERLTFGRGGVLHLAYDPFRSAPRGLLPDRWNGGASGATRWATVTPLVLDRYPKSRTVSEDEVRASFARAGYPTPAEVEVSQTSYVPGGVRRFHPGSWPTSRPHRPILHCRVRFETSVVGPVVAGSLRYLGAGLMVPVGS